MKTQQFAPPVMTTVVLVLLLLVSSVGTPTDAAGRAAGAADTARIQVIVDELRTQLGLTVAVEVAVVESNPLLVSVEVRQPRQSFVLSFEQAFMDQLDADELKAVVAHELGHVWIFTNHPYLQTERQANQIAMRLVSRDALERVYAKVWASRGTKGDLVRFLGD